MDETRAANRYTEHDENLDSCSTVIEGHDSPMAHIVVVEDEKDLAYLIARTLREEGHTTEVFNHGRLALDRLTNTSMVEPDLIVLDLMLPGVDGMTICRRVRQERIIPIVMLTAKSTEIDKVLGLELGADDYVTKPVSLRELQARINAILRRMEMMESRSRTSDNATTPIDDAGRSGQPRGPHPWRGDSADRPRVRPALPALVQPGSGLQPGLSAHPALGGRLRRIRAHDRHAHPAAPPETWRGGQCRRQDLDLVGRWVQVRTS
jgi:CheY-like chemotaxis protein